MKKLLPLILLTAACGKQTKTKTVLVHPNDGYATCNLYATPGINQLPNFLTLSPIAEFKVDSLNSPQVPESDNLIDTQDRLIDDETKSEFAFTCTGKWSAPTSSNYTFYVNSDDGSKLYINDILVVNNDGNHSMKKVGKTVMLLKGVYTLRVEYYNKLGPKGIILSVKQEGYGIEQAVLFE